MVLDADWPATEASATVDGQRSAVDLMASVIGTMHFRGRPETDWRTERRTAPREAARLRLEPWTDPFPRTQSRLAMIIVVSIPVTVALAWATYLSAMLLGKDTNNVKDFSLAMIGAIVGLSGAILGYYYGRGQFREMGSARSRRRGDS